MCFVVVESSEDWCGFEFEFGALVKCECCVVKLCLSVFFSL